MPDRLKRMLYRQRVDDASRSPSNTMSTALPPTIQNTQPKLEDVKREPFHDEQAQLKKALRYYNLRKAVRINSPPPKPRILISDTQPTPANPMPRLNPLAATFRPVNAAQKARPTRPNDWVSLEGVQKEMEGQEDLELIEASIVRMFASNKGLGKLAGYQGRFTGEEFDKGSWNEKVLNLLEWSLSRDRKAAKGGKGAEMGRVKGDETRLVEKVEETAK
ncbi:hypothetical protein BU16DRAFT_536179 [Lophium mytilinum]|uniref:Uncharacterized protein n=1 Tax=Lophium mytilinum TaxID=390894 RepID=A0A6A6R5Z0_9PEZI|nr:hypothetical protein BU16DRAFT_536179 [Lophium mytilinum]